MATSLDGPPDHDIKKIDPGFWTKTSQIQLLFGVWLSMIQFGIGLAFGFATIQVPQLSHLESEITVTRADVSWIASVLPLFCSIGCLISGLAMDRLGRRFILIFCQVPTFIGWVYTGLSVTPINIIIGRAITGIGCGMSMGPPRIYCTEISLPNMRGVVGAFPAISFSLGITVQAGLGKYFHWKALCLTSGCISFINFCLFNWLPESPYYSLNTKTVGEARANLAKFRGSDYNVDAEMEQLIEFKRVNGIRKLTLLESIGEMFTCSSCKPFWLSVTYLFFSQVSGVTCVYTWAIEMLMLANSSYDVHDGNILLASTRLMMCVVASILIYRISRRKLALASENDGAEKFWSGYGVPEDVALEGLLQADGCEMHRIGCSNDIWGRPMSSNGHLSTDMMMFMTENNIVRVRLVLALGVAGASLSVGFYSKYYDKPSLVPQICLMMYMAFASIGYYPLPMLVASELYPLQVRGLLNGATVFLSCLMMFGSTNTCQSMLDFLGVGQTFLIFGGFSLLGTFFLFLYLPETKDLTLQEIEEYYRERRPTLVSQRHVQPLSNVKMSAIKKQPSLDVLKDSYSDIIDPDNSSSTKVEAEKQLAKLREPEQLLSDRNLQIDSSPKLVVKKSRSVTFKDHPDDEDKPSTSKNNSK